MNDKNASYRGHSSLDDRQAAERKLCRLFKSFGIDALPARGRLIDPYLDRAVAIWRPHTGTDFAALAVEEAEADLEEWFAAILGDVLEDRAAAVMTGRAAFLMCSGPVRWADQLLAPIEGLNKAFVAALIDHAPTAVPPSELGEMHHQPYEAWLPSTSSFRSLPLERNFFQGLTDFVRRDFRAAAITWRNIGSIR